MRHKSSSEAAEVKKYIQSARDNFVADNWWDRSAKLVGLLVVVAGLIIGIRPNLLNFLF